MPGNNINEARVHTLQVAVHTMRVGPKQVTMGMFRQLPLADLLDLETLALNGVPWGHVHYWWNGDGSASLDLVPGNRLHVVWQQGDTLRRAIQYDAPPCLWALDARDRYVEADTRSAFVAIWLGKPTEHAVEARYFPWSTLHGETLRHAVERAEIDVIDDFLSMKRNGLPHSAVQDRYLALCTNWEVDPTEDGALEEAARARQTAYETYTAYRATWAERWQELQALDQLFIAV